MLVMATTVSSSMRVKPPWPTGRLWLRFTSFIAKPPFWSPLLKEVVPKASRISVLTLARLPKEAEDAAELARVQLHVLAPQSREEFDEAFSSMVRGRLD